MPSRIVREGILTSLKVDQLSSGAEVFYRRILNVVDDFGRYHGTPALLRAAAFPLKIDKVLDKHITQWVNECVTAGLVKHYSVKGLPYIEIQNFGTPRAKESKYPSPSESDTDANKCKQAQTDASKSTVVVNEFVGVVEKDMSRKRDDYTPEFEQFWQAYPNSKHKGGKKAAFKAWKKLTVAERSKALESCEVFFEAWERATKDQEYTPNASTWLNEGRWDDDLESLAHRWADKYGVYE